MTADLNQALQDFLNDLNDVAEDHGEIFDTAVRENLFEAVYLGFLVPRAGYKLPDRFGMYSEAANAAIKTALQKYLDAAVPLAADLTPQERLDAFQNPEVQTEDGLTPDEFFGWIENITDLSN
ncbi:hypothetical protein [Deinococcus roseus]|uniref:Uncharacterized protein n=1 Tax=Deinococcus roseus TaxID=392414 RepID=A0ABQ2DEZ8_9DEIO|nr:hypothetical protein [Deinococcus roseus]GGJ55010.1 hypothetical protein GCM10008938_46340 [Deinococcus roseus]